MTHPSLALILLVDNLMETRQQVLVVSPLAASWWLNGSLPAPSFWREP